MLPTEKECREIARRALSHAPTGEASVSMTFGQNSNTRFANNEITTSGAAETISIVASVTREARTGRVTLNETSDVAFEQAMKRADELARVLPPDPEHVGPIPPQTYLKIEAFDEATARFGAADRLPGVRAIVEPAREAGMNSSGFFVNGATVQCIANQAGNFGYHCCWTNVQVKVTVK